MPALSTITNPEFDPRIISAGSVDGEGKFQAARNKLYRGRIESVPTAGYGNNRAIYQFRFLYNPTSVAHNSGMDPQYLPISVATDSPDSVGNASEFMQITQNVTFNLLLDRTYDTWAPSNTNYLAQWGVLADIKVLYCILGMFAPTTSTRDAEGNVTFTIDNGKKVDPEMVQQITPMSAHQFQPVWAVFGPRLKYYGIIQNFNVEYTHFTQAMVPNRAVLQIGMQLIPKVSSATTTPKDQIKAIERDYLNSTRGTHVNRGLIG